VNSNVFKSPSEPINDEFYVPPLPYMLIFEIFRIFLVSGIVCTGTVQVQRIC
jgi:hypothetical protein